MVKNTTNQLSKLRRIFAELEEVRDQVSDPQAAVDFLWACIYLERTIQELTRASRKAQEKPK